MVARFSAKGTFSTATPLITSIQLARPRFGIGGETAYSQQLRLESPSSSLALIGNEFAFAPTVRLALRLRGSIMAEHRNSHLIKTLRAALKQVEESEEFSPKDHTFLRLKRSIMLAIADLEDKARRNAPAA